MGECNCEFCRPPKPIHGEPKPENIPDDMHATPPIPCDFRPGDVVEFTNDNGVKFSPRMVRGFANPPHGERFVYITGDCWWFPVKPSALKKVQR